MATLTLEQARNGARRSAESRRERAAELLVLRARVKEFEAALPAKPFVQPSEDYTADRLSRVRKQLDRLDDLIMEEGDPQKLDRLVSASSRLEEQERRLSGRFVPGSTKPQAPPKTTRRTLAEPTVPQPVDAPQPQVAPLDKPAS